MSDFNFSSFLASIEQGQAEGVTEDADDGVQTPPDEVPAIVKKSYSGRRLEFEEGQLEVHLDELFPIEEDDSLPQLLVRQVANLNSVNAANADLPYAKQVAVNQTFLCYALKSGDLRIINRITNTRALVKSHEDDITSVHFMSPDSNLLLISSMDRKISLLEIWEKDNELECKVKLCVSVNEEGLIRVAWGPNNDNLFVFSVNVWVVFVQWAKMTKDCEGTAEFEVKCGEGPNAFAKFLRFDADVTFLRCKDNGLIVGTADGMLQIWNTTTEALGSLFSSGHPEFPEPVIKSKVAEGVPLRHAEIFGDDVLQDTSSNSNFTILTVNYSSTGDPNTILIKGWKCVRADDNHAFHTSLIQMLSLSVDPIDDPTSLSVDYCRREDILLVVERHWMYVLAIRCLHDEDFKFECVTKFPLKQEIVSMELSEKISEEEGLEHGIDVYCVQPMIVQRYVLDPDLTLPEIQHEEKAEEAEPTKSEIKDPDPTIHPAQDPAYIQSLMHEPPVAPPEIIPQQVQPVEAAAKPTTMPMPAPETNPELTMSRPLVLSVPVEDGAAIGTKNGTPLGTESETPIGEGRSVPASSPHASLHSRNRSDRMDAAQAILDCSNPGPPLAVSQSVTAAAMHLLMSSQADRPDRLPEKRDSESDDFQASTTEGMEKEMNRLQNLSMMDSGALPLNPDLSDLVETLERSVSNVKRMIQVLEHKLGRAFHSVNKRLDVNFQDTLTRLDSLQNPGNRGGNEEIDIRLREHTTAAMQGMLDVFQSTIQTEIKNNLRAGVGSAVQRVFAEFLSRQLAGLLNRCVETAISSSLSSAVNQGLQSNFRESFSDSIVPAFELAVQNMFGQIQSAFATGLNEHLAGQNSMLSPQINTILQNGVEKLADFGETAMNEISALKTGMISLMNDVQSMKQDIHNLMAVTGAQQISPTNGAPSAARATPDIVISEIFTLLKDEEYETAFNKALSLSRIDVLNRIINFVDYAALFGTDPCPLSQSVLLSLLNQIGFDLVTDTDLKLKWIRGAVTHLDDTPASPRVGTLAAGVLDYLINKTQSKGYSTEGSAARCLDVDMIKTNLVSGSCLVSAKMTLNVLIGARNMSFSP